VPDPPPAEVWHWKIKKPSTAKTGYQWVWAVLAGSTYFVVCLVEKGDSLLQLADKGTRSALYISLAASSGAMFGFAVTAVTILLTLGGGRRIDWLYSTRQFAYTRIILFGSIRALALSTVVFTALIVVDTHKHGSYVLEAIAAGVVALVLLRLTSVVKLLGDLLEVALQDRREKAKGAPTVKNPAFTEPLDDPPE